MAVEFYEDNAEEHRWRIVDEDEVIHTCHEGFVRSGGALHNLFLNHAMIGVFVTRLAGGSNEDVSSDDEENIRFDTGNDEKIWWKIQSKNGKIIGKSHKGFDSKTLAVDNLIMTYTMLSMFIAMHAHERNTE